MTKKTVLTVLLALCLCLSLAGCSKQPAAGSQPPPPQQGQQQQEPQSEQTWAIYW